MSEPDTHMPLTFTLISSYGELGYSEQLSQPPCDRVILVPIYTFNRQLHVSNFVDWPLMPVPLHVQFQVSTRSCTATRRVCGR